MDAHCDRCKIKTDKKTYENPRYPSQGRPFGYLLLFLDQCPGTAEGHKALLGKYREASDQMHDRRRDLRAEYSVHPELGEFSTLEDRLPLPAVDDDVGEPYEMV